ncbi:MAG: OmpA family protein [Desulfobacteraceae bacterium]|nr:OmpA family protein [Desulfobacteraceae bacterium]
MKTNFVVLISLAGIIFLGSMVGCASKKYVSRSIDNVDKTVDSELRLLRSEIEETRTEIKETRTEAEETRTNIDKKMGEVTDDIVNIRKAVTDSRKEIVILKDNVEKQKKVLEREKKLIREAMKRAEQAGKLKKSKLLYEVTISEESVPFAYKESNLSEDAEAALDVFAGILVKENKAVYIEIQGHTDDIGSDGYNMNLGQERAESVRRYLHTEHNIPLNRMSAFSYGESKPVAENDGEINRSRNRRVVIMVMDEG